VVGSEIESVPEVEAGSAAEVGPVEAVVEPEAVVVPEVVPVAAVVVGRNRVGKLEAYPERQATTAESAVVEGQTLADLDNRGTAEVAGIVSRSDRAPRQHPVAVVGVRRIPAEAKDPVVGFVVGMGRRVAVEGRCLSVAHCTTQAGSLVVAVGEVVADNRCTGRNQAGSNQMLDEH